MADTPPINPTPDLVDSWASDDDGPVALHLKHRLVPVEGDGAPIFPPTYAGDNITYMIDTLQDGTKTALVDSVGSQANRMEPVFMRDRFKHLVPQQVIQVGNDKSVNLLDVGHRLGDALVRSSGFYQDAKDAFEAFERRGDATAIARLAPTSLVFGVWDSRGGGSKVPRLVNAVIRAWDVTELKRSAQYNPPVLYSEHGVVSEKDEEQAQEGKPPSKLAERGFVHVPSVGTHGGVIARGGIFRDVTINLVALRRLRAETDDGTSALRQYVLGLALVAAAEPLDGFLRQGCLLTPDPDSPSAWHLVARTGERSPVTLTAAAALDYATSRAAAFKVGDGRAEQFDPKAAQKDLKDGGKSKS